MQDLFYLKKALNIEEWAFTNSGKGYEYFKKSGDSKKADLLKTILDDETRHLKMVRDMIEKLENEPHTVH